MVLTEIPPVDERVIRDSLASVFQNRAYDYNPVSLWEQLLVWLGKLLAPLFKLHAPPAVITALKIGFVFAIALTIAWVALEIFTNQEERRTINRRRGTMDDAWEAARRLAAAGNFTDAAHALYAALLGSVARRGYVALHDSKTTGDYVRELRPKAAPAVSTPFTEFTRSYETVIYGVGTCDADRYASLYTLATTVAGSVA
jgi:hypothetical protein